MAHFVADVSGRGLDAVMNMGMAEFAGWMEYGRRAYPERITRMTDG